MSNLTEVCVKSIYAMLFFALLCAAPASVAQVSVQGNQKAENFGKDVYGLGLSVGPASGIGISFRNHLPSKISYQLVGGIIKAGDKTSASIGGEFQFDLVRGTTTRLYFGPSISYFYSGTDSNTYVGPFRAGIGVGGELSLQQAVHVSLEGVFVYYSNGDIAPMPQIALHYYFY